MNVSALRSRASVATATTLQGERAKHAETADGCLLALPELNKYVVVGGGGATLRIMALSAARFCLKHALEKLGHLRQSERSGIP